jgi:putative endonuclease
MKHPCVYIMASGRNGTLYAGVTSDLITRVWQHKHSGVAGFTQKYGCKLLVWHKGGSRARKLALIEAMNPQWRDLYEEIL